MRRDRAPTLIAFCLAITLLPAASRAAIIASDDFEVPTHPSSDRREAIGLGLRYYTRDGASAVTAAIAEDATFSSLALTLTDLNTPSATSKAVIGLLPMTLQLENTNDFVTLTFSFHFLNIASVTPAAANFRFGLLSSNGTPVTADSQPAVSDNDQGYYVQVGTGGTVPIATNTFYNERGGIFPILGGIDRDPLTASSAGRTISDNNLHTASFTLTRISSSAISIGFSIDGSAAITATDSSANIRTSFEQIVFCNGYTSTGLNYALDNVVVSSNVPEPSASAIAAVGGFALAIRRRRLSRLASAKQ